VADRIAANHFALIRSFLIDSDGPKALRTVICAKFFCRKDALAANSVNAKCSAFRAQILSLPCVRNELPPSKKSLFHGTFCNVGGVRAKYRVALRSRVVVAHLCCMIAPLSASRATRTRFIKR
jgi:hypothetical protein